MNLNQNLNQNHYREGYSVKRINRNSLLGIPEMSRAYTTREEAEDRLEQIREPGYSYSIVYVTEYLNRAMDSEGNFTLSTFYEIPEPRN